MQVTAKAGQSLEQHKRSRSVSEEGRVAMIKTVGSVCFGIEAASVAWQKHGAHFFVVS